MHTFFAVVLSKRSTWNNFEITMRANNKESSVLFTSFEAYLGNIVVRQKDRITRKLSLSCRTGEAKTTSLLQTPFVPKQGGSSPNCTTRRNDRVNIKYIMD